MRFGGAERGEGGLPEGGRGLQVGDWFPAEAEGLEQLRPLSWALVLDVEGGELMRVEEEAEEEEEEVFLSNALGGLSTSAVGSSSIGVGLVTRNSCCFTFTTRFLDLC